jgi:16S rRNA (adenine1518-N6/adenine1519-N6)-dimethyltransferase
VEYLHEHFHDDRLQIVEANFLKTDLQRIMKPPFALIGNFPYNISSQIFFRVIEYRNLIPEVVGMIQKEVAERIVAKSGNKTYGILSVLLQAWFDIEYCFTVNETVFFPPPKVKSAVIKLRRNATENLGCDEAMFLKVVKAGFGQRRKTLRNALKPLTGVLETDHALLCQRAEQLTVKDFVSLTRFVEAVL